MVYILKGKVSWPDYGRSLRSGAVSGVPSPGRHGRSRPGHGPMIVASGRHIVERDRATWILRMVSWPILSNTVEEPENGMD
jgi:hypothetical protein